MLLFVRFKKDLYVVFLLCILTLVFAGCMPGYDQASMQSNVKITPYTVNGLDTFKTKSGLKYIVVKLNPKGVMPVKGKKVTVNYTGYFTDGKIFDSSLRREEPLSFTLGIGQVIAGWDEGISLLHVGEKARLIIPYELAYGIDGSGPIPPLSTLIFDVELLNAEL